MYINFAEVIAALGGDAGFRIANEARPTASYALEMLLPEMPKSSYDIKLANMTVYATMAGLSGMDATYAPGGVMSVSSFMESSAKITNESFLPEETLRQLQYMVDQIMLASGATNEYLQREVLNFVDKVIVQAHHDTMEWLRGQALAYGLINWTFNKKNLSVNYGIPSGNKLTARTTGNSDAYGLAGSKFWIDVREARRVLRYNVRGFWMNSVTLDEIIYNDSNNLQIINQTDGFVTVQKLRTIGGNTVISTDARDTVTLNVYDGEADILDPADTSARQTVKFIPDGKIIVAGNNSRSGYRVGEGSTPDPKYDLALGYTHIAPTVEGGGRPGRWAEAYVPEGKPYQLNGRGVTNGLPVIEAPEKVVIMTTDIQ